METYGIEVQLNSKNYALKNLKKIRFLFFKELKICRDNLTKNLKIFKKINFGRNLKGIGGK